MAQIEMDGKTVETPDGEHVTHACEELGVVFGCQDGICGTCLSEVLSGMENLTEKTHAENDMGLEGSQRLMCQCKAKGGKIVIKQ